MKYIRPGDDEFINTNEYKSEMLLADIDEILDGLDTSKVSNSQLRILRKMCDLAEDL